ncbi:SIS domain-containing protein [Streptomyces sp. NPDC001780]
MLDESLLDAPDALARADRRGLLRDAAEAGARVRTALRNTAEAGVGGLAPEGRPRAVLIAGSGTAATAVADLLGALAGAAAPVVRLSPTGVAPAAGALRWALPGWAGPVDLLLIATADGSEPSLALLAEQAYRRGCTVVAVAPRTSPLIEAVGNTHGLTVPMAPPLNERYESQERHGRPGRPERPERSGNDTEADGPTGNEPAGESGSESGNGTGAEPGSESGAESGSGPGAESGGRPENGRPENNAGAEQGAAAGAERADTPTAGGSGAFWSLLVPLLALLDRAGLLTAPPETLQKVADRLDSVAERCGPAVATYSNPAKTLAAELAESLPLIWTEGTAAAPAGRRFAAALAELTGRAALAAELPDALPAHSALLAGDVTGGTDLDDFFRDRVEDPGRPRPRVVLLRDRPVGGLTAAPAARDLALGHGTGISELEPEDGSELEALAELLAVTDFATVYLALAGNAPA